MTPWHECRFYTPDATTPVRVTPKATGRAQLLRAWGGGERRHVVRVVDDRGTDLAPADVDWTGIPGGEPERSAGRPVSTGRMVEGSRQVLVRLSADEAAEIDVAAGRAGMSLAAWLRDIGLRAAGRQK